MSRALRIEFPGAVYHVTSRGNERREAFRDEEDRRVFLSTLGRTVAAGVRAFTPTASWGTIITC